MHKEIEGVIFLKLIRLKPGRKCHWYVKFVKKVVCLWKPYRLRYSITKPMVKIRVGLCVSAVKKPSKACRAPSAAENSKTRFTLEEIVPHSWRIRNVLVRDWFCRLYTSGRIRNKTYPVLVVFPEILNPESKVGTLNPKTFEYGEFCRVNDVFLESGYFLACDILSFQWNENGGLHYPVVVES